MAAKLIATGPPSNGEAVTISLSDAVQTVLACADLTALKTALGIADLETRVNALENPE